jgi:hypothetical protein
METSSELPPTYRSLCVPACVPPSECYYGETILPTATDCDAFVGGLPFHTLSQHPSSTPTAFPPDYARHDPIALAYELNGPFICALSGETRTNQYQLDQLLTAERRLYQLRIRRLRPTESRRLSIPREPGPSQSTAIKFDGDTTLYTTRAYPTDISAISNSAIFEIRGSKNRTLSGTINVEQGVTPRLERYWKFWQVTRNEDGDSLRRENAKKIERYGYHSKEEWNKDLLFMAKGTGLINSSKVRTWIGRKGRVVAVEIEGRLEITAGVSVGTKEVLLACWATKLWVSSQISWDQ